MSNILNNNRVPFTTKLNFCDCWDFCLSSDTLSYHHPLSFEDNGLISIDLNDSNCLWFDVLYSSKVWDKAINAGLTFNNIGYTGVDNGLISYEKDRISNKDFLELFLNSKFEIPSEDRRLQLRKVSGNNQIYDYTCNITYVDEIPVIELNGGFYQGFWKSETTDYQLLPDFEENDLVFEFKLKPSSCLTNTKYTLNNKYPHNKGIFFYLGTRSENKFFKFYDTIEFEKTNNGYFEDDYVTSDFKIDNINCDYVTDNTYEELLLMYLENNGYINPEYINYNPEDFEGQCYIESTNYFADDYIASEVVIDEDEIANEEKLNKPKKTFEIKSNNKFLMFDRTCDGLTTSKWKEDTEILIEDYKRPNIGNYFTLFNRTCNGYTVDNIKNVIDKKLQEYDILEDLYNNAIAFQIKEDGSVGYKYLVKDCDNDTYKILSEFSKYNIIKYDEWSTIKITIEKVVNTLQEKTMQIKIYVNEKLKLVSSILPTLNFRALNDTNEKQEGVAYNISLGGGTQGLCDVIYPRYTRLPEYKLPLEKVFGGSFIGYINSFKIENY